MQKATIVAAAFENLFNTLDSEALTYINPQKLLGNRLFRLAERV
jgi:hypothetical protein